MEYAYILTGHWTPADTSCTQIFTSTGKFKTRHGMTRQSALADIMALAKKSHGISEGEFVAVLFFSLEPNRLGGA